VVLYGLLREHPVPRFDERTGLRRELRGCVVEDDTSFEWWLEYDAELVRLAQADLRSWIPGRQWVNAGEVMERCLANHQPVDLELRRELTRQGMTDAWLAAVDVASPGVLLVVGAKGLGVFSLEAGSPCECLMLHRLTRAQRAQAFASLGEEGRATLRAARAAEEEEGRLDASMRQQRAAQAVARAKAATGRAPEVAAALTRRELQCPKCAVASSSFRLVQGGFFVCRACGRSSASIDFHLPDDP
jgi:hypothetical protein